MANPQIAEELNQIQGVVDRLVKDANAKIVFIVDKNGELVAASGDVDSLEITPLGSLTAGAETSEIAKELKENKSATQSDNGEKGDLYMQLVSCRIILVVKFDSKTTLGLVRLRVRKASEELKRTLEVLLKKVQETGADSMLAEITDEDIDNMFRD
ncbi:hypothetical protein PoHVEF18_009775 [Penicillium ochrochloron]